MTATRLLPSHQVRRHNSEVELHIRGGSLEDLLADIDRWVAMDFSIDWIAPRSSGG